MRCTQFHNDLANDIDVVGEQSSMGYEFKMSSSVQYLRTVCTVYPKKYAHGFCFAVLCCGYTLTDFPISIRLTSNDCPSASATLMNMDKYLMWIHYERLHNHNKAKHNKTVCIFLGIYFICRGHIRAQNDDDTPWKHQQYYGPSAVGKLPSWEFVVSGVWRLVMRNVKAIVVSPNKQLGLQFVLDEISRRHTNDIYIIDLKCRLCLMKYLCFGLFWFYHQFFGVHVAYLKYVFSVILWCIQSHE